MRHVVTVVELESALLLLSEAAGQGDVTKTSLGRGGQRKSVVSQSLIEGAAIALLRANKKALSALLKIKCSQPKHT